MTILIITLIRTATTILIILTPMRDFCILKCYPFRHRCVISPLFNDLT
jgi:hypothetical protein